MDPRAVERLAQDLLAGSLPDVQAWDLSAAVQSLADAIDGAALQPIRTALKALNAARQYEQTRLLAGAWTDRRGFDPTVAKHLAQALVNASALDAAQQVLEDGLPQAGPETLEFEGLLGRVAKQRFVATGDRDELVRATSRYLARSRGPSPPYWHAVNAVALRAREEREGIARPDFPETLRDAVLQSARRAHDDRVDGAWPAATVSEALLAGRDCDGAELWLYRFLHHPEVTAFAVESYERQIREIWRGDALGGGGSCADRLAAILARHVAQRQARLSLSPAEIGRLQAGRQDTSAFEKNFSGEGSFSLDTLKRLVSACASIAVVCNARGERLGTGFLVSGAPFGLGPEPVFVTNAHVFSDTVPNAIRPGDARVAFEVESAAAGSPVFHEVGPILFTSPPGNVGVRNPTNDALDVTIARLRAPLSAQTPLATAAALPLVESRAHAYVVGHPRGGGLQIALHDSRLLDVDDDERLLHYRTPTDPGSSGSPVFNEAWEVIGLHHAGSTTTPRLHGAGTYEANEAIALGAIARRLKA
jgi:trypsin-like peptidase/tetratricopeptide repeat protein